MNIRYKYDPAGQGCIGRGLNLQPSAPADQVEDKHNNRDHDENVDQSPGNVQGEAEKPQDHKNDEDCPEHLLSFAPRRPDLDGQIRAFTTTCRLQLVGG